MKTLSPQQIKEKIEHYCAYQERSHQEVRSKLFQLGASENETEEILASLILDGFLNEERFAKAYAGGKFRVKKWGRLKIIHALEKKGVSKNCIQSGLKEIDAEHYHETLKEILEHKAGLLEEPNLYARRDKLSKYAILKGYEPQLVWELLREIMPD
jgi:regulatory protein